MLQVVVELEVKTGYGYQACGILFTSSNWYLPHIMTVQSTVDNLIEDDMTRELRLLSQHQPLGGEPETSELLSTFNVSRSLLLTLKIS